MSDVDLMIEPKNVAKAAEILRSEGWQTNETNIPRMVEIVHSCQFFNADGQEMDLHWRLMRDCWNANKNETFWESAVPLKNEL